MFPVIPSDAEPRRDDLSIRSTVQSQSRRGFKLMLSGREQAQWSYIYPGYYSKLLFKHPTHPPDRDTITTSLQVYIVTDTSTISPQTRAPHQRLNNCRSPPPSSSATTSAPPPPAANTPPRSWPRPRNPPRSRNSPAGSACRPPARSRCRPRSAHCRAARRCRCPRPARPRW